MKEKTSKKGIIITISILLVLLLIGTVLGITGAYFGSNKAITGEVNLSPGIRVDFTNDKDQVTIDYDEKTHEFWLMKYDVTSFNNLKTDSTISRFNVTEVREGAEIAIVAPVMTSETTDDFYIRAKIIFRDSVTKAELTTEQLKEIFNLTMNPITLNDKWLLDENGEWSYYVGEGKSSWTGGVANKDDIVKITEDTTINFLTSTLTAENVEYVPLEISDEVVEHYSVAGFEVILQIQAVEEAKVDEQFFS